MFLMWFSMIIGIRISDWDSSAYDVDDVDSNYMNEYVDELIGKDNVRVATVRPDDREGSPFGIIGEVRQTPQTKDYLKSLLIGAILIHSTQIKGKTVSCYCIPHDGQQKTHNPAPIPSMPQLDCLVLTSLARNGEIKFRQIQFDEEENDCLVNIDHFVGEKNCNNQQRDEFIYLFTPETPVVCFNSNQYKIEKDLALPNKRVTIKVAENASKEKNRVSIVGLSVK